MNIQARVESAITRETGETARLSHYSPCHGGSINESYRIELADGRIFFLKRNKRSASCPGMFELEFKALALLYESSTVRIPRPLVYADEFIVMEWFSEGAPAADWQSRLGQGLAQLHRSTRSARFGFESDNYLGTTLQPNNWSDSWLEFWQSRRLGFQLELFSQNTGRDDPLLKQGQRLLERLDRFLSEVDEPPVLLHGDLWSGNAAATENGEPIIYDPASYYGHREAEIAMMRMFGGFSGECEAAYAEEWPLAPGSEERIRLYRLYHELNHLNLFGRSYYDSCMSTIRSLV